MAITTNIRHQLIKAYSEPKYLRYLQDKYEWNNKTVHDIAWKCLNLGLKRINREVILVKICNDLLPTATTPPPPKANDFFFSLLCGDFFESF